MDFINKFLQGDSLAVLKTLPDKCVNMCVTSPPYWAQRDYGVKGQLGLEKTPEEFVANLVEIFTEVRRVLKDDGTLWLNLGDSYVGTGHKGEFVDPKYAEGRNGQVVALNNKVEGYKRKDLVGIPWMTAFALRTSGYYLRQDIIWSKKSPMPESVKDRCTKSHEYIFLLSKKDRYYFDYKAIRTEGKNPEDDFRRIMQQRMENKSTPDDLKNGLRPRGHERPHSGFDGGWDSLTKEEQQMFGANKRSVWHVAAKPYREAHFATFPEELIAPCILAGCPEGGIVLDPFMGAGTTALVALKNHRKFVGIELNPEYIKLSEDRIKMYRYSDNGF